MKLHISLLAASCAVLTACISEPVKPTVTHTYDRYIGMEITTAGPFEVTRALSWEFNKGTSKVGTDSGKSVFTLRFVHNGAYHNESSRWQYLTNHQLYLLIDGKSYDIGAGKHDGDVKRSGAGGPYVVEVMNYGLGPEYLNLMAYAKSISGRIGRTEFTTTPEQLAVLRAFAKAGTPSVMPQ